MSTRNKKNLPILSFNLNCRYHFLYLYNNDFTNLVYEAIKRGVEILNINLCHYSVTTLPTFVLTTKTLSVLKLKRVTITSNEQEFHLLDLPSLKVLHMESVIFTYSLHIMKLLSGCPILQELEAKDSIRTKRCLMMPSGRNELNLSNLVRANIRNSCIEFDWLHNVTHLRIQVIAPSYLHGMFHNLTHLQLIFKFAPERTLIKWNWLMEQLPNFPKLQTLIIHQADTVNNFGDIELEEVDEEDPKIVPGCLLSHLTTCSLRNYSHINCELQFVEYIMQNLRVLSTLTIQIAKFVEKNTKHQIFTELSLCQEFHPHVNFYLFES